MGLERESCGWRDYRVCVAWIACDGSRFGPGEAHCSPHCRGSPGKQQGQTLIKIWVKSCVGQESLGIIPDNLNSIKEHQTLKNLIIDGLYQCAYNIFKS